MCFYNYFSEHTKVAIGGVLHVVKVRCSVKEGVHKQSFTDFLQYKCSLRFCKFQRETLVMESLYNEVAGLEVFNFIKKRFQVFSCEICEIFKNKFFYRTLPMAASETLLISQQTNWSLFLIKLQAFRPSEHIWRAPSALTRTFDKIKLFQSFFSRLFWMDTSPSVSNFACNHFSRIISTFLGNLQVDRVSTTRIWKIPLRGFVFQNRYRL